MCGIVGLINKQLTDNQWQNDLQLYVNTLTHRGPDAQGIWYDGAKGIGFGHRRLSIVDLSQNGHQPMDSNSGRYTITFNGEIYNYREIKEELIALGHRFKSTSDTEVILGALEEWNLLDAVEKFNGMFAMGVYDRELEVIHLIRDRMGIKPLYYCYTNGIFMFGSELKPFKRNSRIKLEVSRNNLTQFFRLGYLPVPMTVYKNVFKIPPGTIYTFNMETGNTYQMTYWSLEDIFRRADHSAYRLSEEETLEQLEGILSDAIECRMIADVPLGAFLSGGIDSSLVVALMQKLDRRKVKTFSIGFREKGYNEAHHAASVANYLGTEHQELYVSDQDALNIIPKLKYYYDEPFADPSQVPTFLLSQMTRENVTVSLSGDGGDELFLGYDRYLNNQKIWSRLKWIPTGLRKKLGYFLQSPRGASLYKNWFSDPTMIKPNRYGEMISSSSFHDYYINSVSAFVKPDQLFNPFMEESGLKNTQMESPMSENILEDMMLTDMALYLPDDILVKVDRASMAHGLEARVPLLDYHMIEFAINLPLKYKYKNGKSKYILRQLLNKHLPRQLYEREKMGFGMPLSRWLRGPLKDWTHDLLNPSKIKNQGILNQDYVQKVWSVFRQGDTTYLEKHMWCLLVFQLWMEEMN